MNKGTLWAITGVAVAVAVWQAGNNLSGYPAFYPPWRWGQDPRTLAKQPIMDGVRTDVIPGFTG